MRDGTIIQLISANNRKLENLFHVNIGALTRMNLEAKLGFNTLMDILYNRWKLLKFIVLVIISPVKAQNYFAKLYIENREVLRKEVNQCSSQEKKEMVKEDSSKDIKLTSQIRK